MRHSCAIILYLCLAVVCNLKTYGQTTVNPDSLASDFSYLVKQLELTHPDPYSGFGGKVFFHKQAFDLTNDIRRNKYTTQQFFDKISAFLANLNDGHTLLIRPNTGERNKASLFPIVAKVIPDGLIIRGVLPENKVFLGSRILGVNGVSTDSLLKAVGILKACENIYGQYSLLNTYLSHSDFILKLFPETKDKIYLNIETPDGIKTDIPIPLLSMDTLKKCPKAQLPRWDVIPTNYMSYQFMDKAKDIMLLKLTRVMARENFETMIHGNWPKSYEQMRQFYKQTLSKEMPTDTAEALNGLPSFSETFYQMLTEMKKEKARTLIIDLRGNGGGWTPITLPSLYQLFGDKYIETDMDTRFYRLLSPLYLLKTNQSLEEFNQGHNSEFQLGDYTFEEDRPDTASIITKRKYFIENCMSDTKPKLEKQQGKPVYTPENIYVVTDERTFSAAFHYAFYLWKMGATIVGIPCMQAPNTFMEQTPFQLPYTQLNGSISNSMQIFLPPNDRRAKTFWPDLMPTYDDYKRYQFDIHSEIRYLLDQIEQKK